MLNERLTDQAPFWVYAVDADAGDDHMTPLRVTAEDTAHPAAVAVYRRVQETRAAAYAARREVLQAEIAYEDSLVQIIEERKACGAARHASGMSPCCSGHRAAGE